MKNPNFSLDICLSLCNPENARDFRFGNLAIFSKNPIKNNQKMILKKFKRQRSTLSVGSLLNNRKVIYSYLTSQIMYFINTLLCLKTYKFDSEVTLSQFGFAKSFPTFGLFQKKPNFVSGCLQN